MALPVSEIAIRDMADGDLAAVARIEKTHTLAGRARPRRQMRERLDELRGDARRGVALVGVSPRGRVVGYLVGDVRTWEFGSEPAGWIFAIGVEPAVERHGLGQRLVDAATRRFAQLGVGTVRTMVHRDDVAVLRFFRSQGFAAGPYLELELDSGGR